MVSNPFKGLSHAVKKAGKAVASSVIGAGAGLLHTASEAAQSGSHFVSRTFIAAVKGAEGEFKAAEDKIQRIVGSGEEAASSRWQGRKFRSMGTSSARW
jgi:hypothetical protein